jgi:hypothetical protein
MRVRVRKREKKKHKQKMKVRQAWPGREWIDDDDDGRRPKKEAPSRFSRAQARACPSR